MEQYQSVILMIASRILSYPTEKEEKNIIECAEQMDTSNSIKLKLMDAIDSVYRIPLHERREIYVATFDLKTNIGLYLTAHEFGDSPKRGAALIKLQKIINEAGYERIDGELADYIPMLYEFTAISENNKQKERLIKRLSCATQIILNHLPSENPYYEMVSILMEYVFEQPSREELAKMEQEREEADLEELPYPIMYT